jgi:hypothetical protein
LKAFAMSGDEHCALETKETVCLPGCKELTVNRYCEQHQKLMDKRYDTYERSPVSQETIRQSMEAHPGPLHWKASPCARCA